MLPRKRAPHVITAPEASAIVEWLWAGFEQRRDRERCPCGCAFVFTMHMYSEAQDDELVREHLTMDTLDVEPVTRLENWWRHYQRWGHDGRNPLGGRAVALPTWLGKRP